MSGVLNILVTGGGAGHLTGTGAGVANTSASTGIRSGTFALINDGTFTATGGASGNWFVPTTASIGTSWWAKAVINTQANTSSTGTFGSFVQLTAGSTSWAFSNSGASLEGTGNMTISFSPDGGTTTAGTMVVTWDVGFAP